MTGEHIISGSADATVRVWNLKERRQEVVLNCRKSSIYSIELTYNYKYIVSCSYDAFTRVWKFKRDNR